MIPVFRPSLGEAELSALRAVFKNGWVGLGPKTAEFEERFAAYIGVRHAVAVNSCTAALHLALQVMGVEGGEVVTTPMTFVSTSHAILYNRAHPVFADIEPDTLTIAADSVRERVTRRTRAILVMHYGGHPCDMAPLLEIAHCRGLKVIEDAAHGCGGEYRLRGRWRKLGSLGDIGCFSFQAVKNLTTGDGGMITTNDARLAARLKKLRWMWISRGTWDRGLQKQRYEWAYEVEEVGYKYYMNDISAAIGLVQLKKLETMNRRRRMLAGAYTRAFSPCEQIETPVEKPYARSACHNYVIKVARRNALIRHLNARGISAGVHYIPTYYFKAYASYQARCPVTERVWKRLVTLPLYYGLTQRQQERVIRAVQEFKRDQG